MRRAIIPLLTVGAAAVGLLAALEHFLGTPASPETAAAPGGAVAGPDEPMLFPSNVLVSGPDEFGVVCYTFHVGSLNETSAISCVKVKP